MYTKRELKGQSLSWGTMREIDLIPAFCDFLQEQGPRKYKAIIAEGREWENVLRNAEEGNYNLSADEQENISLYLNEELWDAVDSESPTGYSFCSSEGDGSDYGFWKSQGF